MTVQTFATLVALESSACGRVGFDSLSDAASDATRDGGNVTSCSATAPFTNIRALTDLSSPMGDGGLRVSADELTAYFHSERPLGSTYYVFTATRGSIDAQFSTPVAMSINGYFPTVTSDEQTLAYDDLGDIYLTTRTDTSSPFVASLTPLAGVSTVVADIQPFLSADGSALYFVRIEGSFELYVGSLPAGPVQPIAELNTGAFEANPVISADGLTLYYASRVDGTVLWDIWRATRESTVLPFGPGALISELDHPQNDAPTSISADNCRLYFESSRVTGAGMYDLYVAERTP